MLNNKVSKAVRLAIAFGAASTAAFSANTFAADEEGAEKVERIEVTGSRIKRVDMEGVAPITVITAEDLEITGEVSVADVLRDSTFNSFGSGAESSGQGGGTQGIASASLRGLGADRTLLLINGKRVAPSPAAGGGSANLNAIPMAAVERIDIVSSGASAIYGSDAIGGVINVVLKKDFEGVEISGSAGRPSAPGADENSAQIVFGLAFDKGNFVMSAEHSDREVIYSRDREYTKSIIGETWEDNTGISPAGRNIRYFIDDDGDGVRDRIEWRGIESQCDTSNNFAGMQTRGGTQPGTMCGYNYSNIAAETTDLTNSSIYARGVYNITDDLSFNLNILATRFTSAGRFAPAAGNFNITGTDLAADNIDLPEGSTILASRASWRFTDNGPRDSRTLGNNFDVNAYLTGYEDWGQWDVGVHRNVSSINEIGTGYINQQFAEQFAAEGTLTDERSIALMAHTITTWNKTDYTAYNAGFSIDSLGSLEGGDIGAYFYFERVESSYRKQADSLSNASAVIGSSGGEANGDRQVTSVATEFLFPVIDGLDLTLAARYDDYSDFGDNLSPQIGVTYSLNDDYLLRGSWGQGFRAPTFANLYNRSQGFPWVYVTDLGWGQFETNTVGNENLDPEKTNQFNIGIVGNLTDSINFTLDYNLIELEDMIAYESAANIWDKYEDGIAFKPGTGVEVVGGIPERFTASYINEGEMRAQYIDLNLKANQETAFGTFRQNLQVSYTVSYETLETDAATGDEFLLDAIGLDGLPDYRATLNLGWDYEDHSVNVTVKYIPSQLEEYRYDTEARRYVGRDEARAGKRYNISSYADIDVNYRYNVTDALTLAVGARNLTNEDPSFANLADTEYNSSLYSMQGRTYYASFKYSF